MRLPAASCLLAVLLATIPAGCCLIPVPSIDDPNGTAPGLAGTWLLESEGNELLTMELDGTGDPVSASYPTEMLKEELPFEVPSELVLDGQQHVVGVGDLPIWLIYIGSAEAIKDGSPDSAAIGDAIDVNVLIKLYVRLPLLLTPALKMAEVTLAYKGAFTGPIQAMGEADVGVEFTGVVDLVIGLFGGEAEDFTTSITQTELTKQ